MENRPPEGEKPKPREYTIGQEFQLFPHGEDAEFVLDVESRIRIPFKSYLAESGTILDTITPFEPEKGYTVSDEDLHPFERLKKLQRRTNESEFYDTLFLPDHGLITVSIQHILQDGIKDEHYDTDFFERLGLVISLNHQSFVGIPDVLTNNRDEIDEIYYYGFVPSDIGTEIPFSGEINRFIAYTFEKRDIEPGEFNSHSFNIGVPRGDSEKTQSIRARFVPSPVSFHNNN